MARSASGLNLSSPQLAPRFVRLGISLRPDHSSQEREGILNPACARLRDGSLRLYPRMVAPGNVSRIGSFRATEGTDGAVRFEQRGYALEPHAPYEFRNRPGGYGCEDPRVTFVAAIDRYVMAYVAFGPRGPQVAIAISEDGLSWQRLGLMHFGKSDVPVADKDAAFFSEPVRSPSGELSLAFYHRPTLRISVRKGQRAVTHLEAMPPQLREGIALGYVSLEAAQEDVRSLCTVAETHRLEMPPASWGTIKVGAGTRPVRVREGWLAVIHGVDPLQRPSGRARLRYCAGLIVHDAERLDRVIYRSADPLFVPEAPEELRGTVGHVVFPTGIDPHEDKRAFDIYYGMADFAIGRGRLTLDP
ncbi:MAG: glycosidase [Vulcanimicrobiaceae bacterium]